MEVAAITLRQEAFCIEYLKNGCNAARAYGASIARPGADPKRFDSNAQKYLRNINVQARIRELQALAAENAGVTAADIIRQLDEDRKFARESKQASAMVKATEAKARLLGLDKNETNVTIRPDDARQIISTFLAKYAASLPLLAETKQ
jgi:hypothetical protein